MVKINELTYSSDVCYLRIPPHGKAYNRHCAEAGRCQTQPATSVGIGKALIQEKFHDPSFQLSWLSSILENLRRSDGVMRAGLVWWQSSSNRFSEEVFIPIPK